MVKQIYFAGGCFWGVEKYFSLIPGVTATEAGYANGHVDNPSYEQVRRGDTGFAETVKVSYDEDSAPLFFLLAAFFEAIDPFSLNRQGPDAGTQYRTGIYTDDPRELDLITRYVQNLERKAKRKIETEVLPLSNYYPAEEYHQRYLEHNQDECCHIDNAVFEKIKNLKLSDYKRKSDEELKQSLSDLQYRVTREDDTEKAFLNEYYNEFREGIYVDITTGEPLFVSADKFDSGCGWPAFSKPVSPELIAELEDRRDSKLRTEVRSVTGNAHLGHVFNDGPKELGGLRYCINSASLRFIPEEEMEQAGYGNYLHLLRRTR
ncbi:MAG: peptide-methionine (R)-S-oxide reductase MsrB [Spirochaetaceae bacterium]|jgi:peptide methionine sulfoxide reductase msrA/msrB|nr:peptide-methionine (R)-S-oxide reductase MsrB [Spirochaetaceae bacterium]